MCSLKGLLRTAQSKFRELRKHRASPKTPLHTSPSLLRHLDSPIQVSNGSPPDAKQNPPEEPIDIPEEIDVPEERICSVCYELEPEPTLYFCFLPCGHSAHPKCIKSWLEHSPNKDCHLCRKSLRYEVCGHPLWWTILLPGKVIDPSELALDCHGCLQDRITDDREACNIRDFGRVIDLMEDCRCVMNWLLGAENPTTTGPALLKMLQTMAKFITRKADGYVFRLEEAIESFGRGEYGQMRLAKNPIDLMKHLNSVYIHQVDTAIELMKHGEDMLVVHNRNNETQREDTIGIIYHTGVDIWYT
jgi:hypothetical protein